MSNNEMTVTAIGSWEWVIRESEEKFLHEIAKNKNAKKLIFVSFNEATCFYSYEVSVGVLIGDRCDLGIVLKWIDENLL